MESKQVMSIEVSRKGYAALPAWVSREVVLQFTGLRGDDVRALVEAKRLRTLAVGKSGKRVRYNKLDLGELCGFTGV